MLVLGIISAILVLGYIYFKPTPWENVTQSERLELVFKNKNKSYGAYQLRKDYNRNLSLILLSLIFFLSTGFIASKLVKSEDSNDIKVTYTDNTTFNIKEPPKENPEVIKKEEPKTQSAPKKTTSFVPPVVTDDDIITDVPVNDELNNSNISVDDNGGDSDFTTVDGVGDELMNNGTEIKPDSIFCFVDEDPEFPGGYDELKKFIANNIVYSQDDIYLNIQGKVMVKFAVEKDGSISNISIVRGVSTNCDKSAINLLKKMPNWKPGRMNGRPVRVWCTIPIIFELQ